MKALIGIPTLVSSMPKGDERGNGSDNASSQQDLVPSPAGICNSNTPSYFPFWLQRWTSIPVVLSFILIAAGSEALYVYSQRHQGFRIELSREAQFLKSFLPSLLFILLNWVYGNVYDSIRGMQPYMAMYTGNAPAKDSVLVSYGAKGPLGTLIEAGNRRHPLIFAASLFSLWGLLYGALGGAYFSISPVNVEETVPIILNTAADPNSLFWYSNSMSAVGYVDMAEWYGCGYPPSMFRDPQDQNTVWSIAPFELNKTDSPITINPVNGSQVVRVSNVHALQIHVECKPATSINYETSVWNYNMTAAIDDSCSSYSVVHNITTLNGYSWTSNFLPVEPSCIPAINPSAPNPSSNLNQTQYPMATLFILNQTTMSAAFCYATYKMYNVTAELDVLSGRIVPQVWNASLIRGYFSGQDYVFPPTGFVHVFDIEVYGDSFDNNITLDVQLAGAVINRGFGAQNGVTLWWDFNAIMSNSTAVAEIALDTYLMYQTLMSPFLLDGSPSIVNATYSYTSNRIVVFGPSAHAIAALSAANGFALLAMFCIHFSQRRLIESHGRRVVAKPPTSIAGIGALVSERHRPPSGKPGFLDGLTPADTAEELELKLTSWEFSFAADGRIIGQRLQNAPA